MSQDLASVTALCQDSTAKSQGWVSMLSVVRVDTQWWGGVCNNISCPLIFLMQINLKHI